MLRGDVNRGGRGDEGVQVSKYLFPYKTIKNGWIAHIQLGQHDRAGLPWGP